MTIDRVTGVPPAEGGVSAEAPIGLRPFSTRGRASTNLRGHLAKAAVRLSALVALDLGAVGLGRAFVGFLRSGALGDGVATGVAQVFPHNPIGVWQVGTAIVVAMLLLGSYRAGDYWRDPARVLGGVGLGIALVLYQEFWQGQPVLVLGKAVAIWLPLSLTVMASRLLLDRVAHTLAGGVLGNHVLEIRAYADSRAHDLGPNYHVLSVIPVDGVPEDVAAMESWLTGGVDTLLIADEIPDYTFRHLTDFALTHGCSLLSAYRPDDRVGIESRRTWIKGKPYYELTAPTLRAPQLLLKRLLDIVGSVVLLALLALPMILIAVLVKLDSPGPVFFRQKRAGYMGRFFRVMKFRSMRADAEEALRNDRVLYQRYLDNDFKLPEHEDPRVTRLGRFLRKTSLDELPQLLNVLLGHMSLVGPRPVVEPELEMYRGRIPTFLSVKPGVTGLWQISGRSEIAFPERAELDLDYVRNWSLLRDFWILLMTVPAVLVRRGAH